MLTSFKIFYRLKFRFRKSDFPSIQLWKWISSFYKDYSLTIMLYDHFACWIGTFQWSNFVVPLFKGVHPPWMKWILSFSKDYCLTILLYDHFACWKGTLQGSYFGFTVYKGVNPPWMKWNPTLNDDFFQNFQQVKISLSEKWLSKYSTLELPFIKGPHPHEWNEYHPSPKTTV